MNGKIYTIKNSINNKIYIGQTIQDVETRFKQHLKLLKSSKNQIIYKAINAKGKEKFSFEILEQGIENYQLLNTREEYYIRKYNSLTPNGYNLCPGGQKWRRKPKLDEITQEKIIKLYLSGKSARTIATLVGVSFSTILKVLKRKGIKRRDKECRLPDRTSILDKEQLKKLYLDDGLSSIKIGLILNISDSTIRRAIRRFNLTRI